jgi:hypothetical protein
MGAVVGRCEPSAWLAGLHEVGQRTPGAAARAVSKSREDADIDEELREHLEMQVLENLRRGMSVDEARRQQRSPSADWRRCGRRYATHAACSWWIGR